MKVAGSGPNATTSIVTGARFSAPPDQVWNGLMYYEQIPYVAPLHLRLVLPTPVRTEGRRSSVGDETRCVYDRGHLLKRVTRIDPSRHYGFDVVEQDLAIGGGIRLMGGSYTLRELPDGSTRIALETRYVSRVRPRWLAGLVEAAVGHAFHRHILGAMRRQLESLGSRAGFERPGAAPSGDERPSPSSAV